MKSLGLEGLVQNESATMYALGESGRIAPISGPVDRTAFGIKEVTGSDGQSYLRYRKFMNRIRPVISRFLTQRPLNLLAVESEAPMELLTRALGLRLLGSHDMVELLRVAPMPVRDFLDEYFESDFIKGALSMHALLGAFAAPRSPGTTTNLLMHESMSGLSIKGGSLALTDALTQRARDLGVFFKCGHAVTRILVDNKSVKGVELENGSIVEAIAVSASINPKTVLLDLLPVSALTYTSTDRISNFRSNGTTAHLLLAVEGPVLFEAASKDQNISRARIAPTLDHVEKAFDAVKYNRFSESPVLDISIPSIETPSLAPSGKNVVSVMVSYAPLELEGGWNDAARATLTNSVVDMITDFVPGFERQVIAARLSTPADLENDYGLTGGHLHHGEPGLDQILVRPIPECFNHETPVEGLTLCGSGAHPGGSVSCMAGALATHESLPTKKARSDAA
jgi:phytoene dehydrogenase-like protein